MAPNRPDHPQPEPSGESAPGMPEQRPASAPFWLGRRMGWQAGLIFGGLYVVLFLLASIWPF